MLRAGYGGTNGSDMPPRKGIVRLDGMTGDVQYSSDFDGVHPVKAASILSQ